MVTVCVYARRCKLERKAIPKASISSAQNGNTGQNPMTANIMLKANENRQVAPKKSLAPAAVSEQLGASSIRVSMGGKDNPGAREAAPIREAWTETHSLPGAQWIRANTEICLS